MVESAMNKKNKINLFSIYNLRYQRRNKKGFWLNLITISIGIAVFLCIQAVLAVNKNNISNHAYAKVGGDMAMVCSDSQIDGKMLDRLNLLENEKKLSVTKAIWLQGSLSVKKRNSMCVIRYIDTEKYPYYKLKSDSSDYKKLREKGTIFLSKRLASSLNSSVGDKVKLQGFVNNSSEYTIAGIVPEDGEDSMDMNIYGYVFIDIHTLEQETKMNLENVASKIYIKGDTDVLDGLRKEFPKMDFQTMQNEKKDLMKEYKGMSSSYNGLGILTLVIAFIGIIASMILTIMKRQKDICIFKVYGATNFEIAKLFLKEILFTTFLGIVLGEFLGGILSVILCKVFYGYLISIVEMPELLAVMLKVFIIGLVTGALFGIFPLLLTMQFKPITILRAQTVFRSELKKRSFFLCGILFFFLLGSIFSVLVRSITGFAIVVAGSVLLCMLFLIALGLLKLVIAPGLIGKNSVKKIALKSMKKDGRKFAIVEVTMSICVAVMGMVLLMYNSILPSLEKQVQSSLGYDVLFKVESSQANAVETVLRKANIQNYYTSTTIDFHLVSLNGKKPKENEMVYSMDCMHDDLSYVNDNMIEGNGISKEQSDNTIVVDEEFFAQFGLKINDIVTLQFGSGKYDFKISGVRKSEKIKTGHAYAYYDAINQYVSIPKNQNIIRYYVVCSDTERFIQLVNEKFDDIVALDIKDISAPYAATLNQNLQMLKVVSVLCMGSALFLIFNILSITYLGKRKDFLILGLYGAKERNKRAVILIQGVFLGLSSAVLAFVISVIGALFLEVMTGIQVNYDGITAIEVVGLALLCSVVSVAVLSKGLVKYREYGVLRTE